MTTPAHLNHEELSGWLDGELELDAARQTHLKGCAECSAALDRLRALRRAARAAVPPVPTDRMWKAIEARTAGTAPGRGGWLPRLAGWRLPVAGLGTALALLLMMVLGRPVPGPIPVPVTPAAEPESTPVPPVQKTASATRRSATSKKADRPAAAPARRVERTAALDSANEAPAAAPAATELAERAAPSSAPAAGAAAPAMTRAPAPARPRAIWRGQRVTVTADQLARPTASRIVLIGQVVVQALKPGQPFVVTINGLSQTLTGRAEAARAEIRLPAEEIVLTR